MRHGPRKTRTKPLHAILFTCEHARNSIPPSLKWLFNGKTRLLSSHQGWDDGALLVAQAMAKHLKAPLVCGEFSRLVVDLNRSLHHRRLFSEYSCALPPATKQLLVERVYHPFRRETLNEIQNFRRSGKKVHHFSVHSFTPVLNGEIRPCDIGILYNPKRPSERLLARSLKSELETLFPDIRIRMNYPYRGTSDGHTTLLRSHFSDSRYTGIELEFNQAWISKTRRSAKRRGLTYRLLSQAIRSASQHI